MAARWLAARWLFVGAAAIGCDGPTGTILQPGASREPPPSANPTTTASSDPDEGDLPPADKLDLPPSDPVDRCGDLDGDGMLDVESSFIWIANSAQGTVSKIDTVTALEQARYRTGPETEDPDPSRTSVDLWGDVAVLNRSGSILKIAAQRRDCRDLDGDGRITTSSGPQDMLPWGTDECVLWAVGLDFVAWNSNDGGPRGLAFDGGTGDPCKEPVDERLWVGWGTENDVAVVERRFGDDGSLERRWEFPNWDGHWDHGIYGAATNADGDLWALGTKGTLVHIDAETLEVRRHQNPTQDVVYGIAVDAQGTPWLSGWDGKLWRFDTDNLVFVQEAYFGGTLGPITGTQGRGIAVDRDGVAWIAANDPPRLVRFDTLAGTQPEALELPGSIEPVGVAVDHEGFVWVVDRGADRAYKFDPAQRVTIRVVSALVSPYTYSDMTGASLRLVTFPP